MIKHYQLLHVTILVDARSSLLAFLCYFTIGVIQMMVLLEACLYEFECSQILRVIPDLLLE